MKKPSISELGLDLLEMNLFQKILLFARPFFFISLFFITYHYNFYWILPFIIFFLFVSVITLTHDLVHQTLGFSQKTTNLLLFFSGLLILESGHSYQITHHIHHRNFPNEHDIEGEPAKNNILKSLLIGPIYIPKLFIWALKHVNSQKNHQLKKWLLCELLAFFVLLIIGVLFIPITKAIITFMLMVIMGGWFYPLITVYTPHKKYNGTELGNTICYRGKISPYLFINLIFHLEHHLYPQVPTCNLNKLANRINPYFDENKEKIIFQKLI